MIKKALQTILIIFSFCFTQSPYSLEDLNPNSSTYGNNVGSNYFEGKVVLHYFGAFTWGTCTTRFGELNDINDDLKSNGYEVELIGVSKSSWQAGLVNWVNQGDAAICIDESPFLVWDDWEASQRDLFITDVEGQVVFKENITSEIPSNILDIIFSYLSTDDSFTPLEFHLKQNYPNPFNGRTSINFSLPFSAYVDLKIFDMNGEVVKTLYQGYHNKNEQSKIIWDGKNDLNKLVSSGIYLYSIESLGRVRTKKLTFIK